MQYNIAADTGREEEDITFQAIATGGQQEERLGKERGGLGSIRGEVGGEGGREHHQDISAQ